MSGEDLNATWSPRGTQITFCSNRDGDYEIYTMHSDGTGVTQLTFNAIPDTEPVWNSGGAMILLTRTRLRSTTSMFIPISIIRFPPSTIGIDKPEYAGHRRR